MEEIRHASTPPLRSALLRVKKHLLPANFSALEDASCRESEVPTIGTSPLLLAAQSRGTGSRAEKVALESVDRMRPV